MSAESRIARARANLIMSAPFYGTLSLALDVVRDDSISTMATDGRRLIYNAAFVDSLTDSELRGVVAHEVLHCALGHHVRRGARDPREWNVACDLAINPEIRRNGFTLPKCALDESRFHDMTAEEIYAARAREKQERDKQKQNGGQEQAPGNKPGGQSGAPDPGRCGGIVDPCPAHDAAGMAKEAADWEARVGQALSVAAAQNNGKIPASLARVAQDHGRARVDWRETLRRFIDDSTVRDYTFLRPNRRHIGRGIILPGTVADAMRELVVCVDTSGSIDADTLNAFAAEIGAALDEGCADLVTVIYCDAAVRGVDSFERGEPVKLEPKGGGGTRFSPAFAHVAEHCNPSAVIYFTDMVCDDWGEEPGAPVLWAAWGNPKSQRPAPFGEVLRID